MNETGNYPGQAWLWLYTFWYQVPPFTTSTNADAQIWAIMAILSLALVCIPFIPGVRSLPRAAPRLPADLARLLPRGRALLNHTRGTEHETQPSDLGLRPTSPHGTDTARGGSRPGGASRARRRSVLRPTFESAGRSVALPGSGVECSGAFDPTRSGGCGILATEMREFPVLAPIPNGVRIGGR